MNGHLPVLLYLLVAPLTFIAAQEAYQNTNGNEELNSDNTDKDTVSRQAIDNGGPSRNSRTLYNQIARPGDPYSYPGLPNQVDGRGYALRPVTVDGRGYQYPLQYGRPDVYGVSNFDNSYQNFPFTNFGDPFFGANAYQNDFFGIQQPRYNNIPYYNQNPAYYDVRLYRPGINPYYGYSGNGRPAVPLNPNGVQPLYQQYLPGGYPGYPPRVPVDGLVRPPNGLTTGIALQPNGIGNGVALQANGIGVPIGDGYAQRGIAIQKDGVTLQTSTGIVGPNGNGVQNNAAGISDYVDRDANGVPFLVHPSVRGRYANQHGRTGTQPVRVDAEQSQRNGYYRNYRTGRPLRVGDSFLSPPSVRRPNSDERDRDGYQQRRDGVYDPEQRVHNLDYVESLINNVQTGPRYPVHPLPYAIMGDMNLDRRPNGDGYTTPVALNPESLQRLNNGRPRVVLRVRNRAYTSGYSRQ